MGADQVNFPVIKDVDAGIARSYPDFSVSARVHCVDHIRCEPFTGRHVNGPVGTESE